MYNKDNLIKTIDNTTIAVSAVIRASHRNYPGAENNPGRGFTGLKLKPLTLHSLSGFHENERGNNKVPCVSMVHLCGIPHSGKLLTKRAKPQSYTVPISPS